MVDLTSLNPNQKRAVEWADGPLLVLAGPGSGKTRVLTYRIARIIEATEGKHFRILGLTFTNKAAAEMRSRVESLVPNVGGRVLLTTFHSFCVSLLRQHGHHIGLRPDFIILSQPVDRQSVLEDAIAKARSEHQGIPYRAEQLLPLVNGLLDNCVPGNQAVGILQERNVNGASVIGAIYRNYRQLMLENNQMDFGGIIAETLELLESKPAVRKFINRIYPYVCVDEFQDTNLAQYRVLHNIVNRRTGNLFVVADDDQIIYQWNGASPERLKKLQDDFNMPVLQLPENYRCPQEVIEVANNLILHNPSHSSDKVPLVAIKGGSNTNAIQVKEFASREEETNWIASDIASRKMETRYDCVVLGRTRRLLEQVLESLNSHEVDSYIAVRKDEFISNPMIWLHAVLRLANARQDREQLRRICKSYYDLVGTNLDAGNIMSDSVAEEGDYLRAWQRAALRQERLDAKTRKFLEESVSNLADRLDFRTFIKDSFAWFGKLPEVGHVFDADVSEYLEEKKTWQELENEVVNEVGQDQVTLNVLLQGLDLRSKTPQQLKDAVPCFTIHASKGQEFAHVYLVGMVEDELPSWAAIKKGNLSREMEEERRNCFVAVTRVQESLTLTYSHSVLGRIKKPSRFLKEMKLVS